MNSCIEIITHKNFNNCFENKPYQKENQNLKIFSQKLKKVSINAYLICHHSKREKTKEREEKQRFGVCLSGIEVCLSEFRNMGHLSKIYTYTYSHIFIQVYEYNPEYIIKGLYALVINSHYVSCFSTICSLWFFLNNNSETYF